MTARRRTQAQPTGETVDATASSGLSTRRKFLAVAGVGSAAAATVAVTGRASASGSDDSQSGSYESSAPSRYGENVDVAIAKFAAGLEVVAVGAYKATLAAAQAGTLGPVPPAVADYVGTALLQHTLHLARWNEILRAVGQPAVTEPNEKLQAIADEGFASVTDVIGAAKLARTLEETAAATYLYKLSRLTNKSFRQLAGSIQIIDAQHVAILNYVLGEYPVPETFAKTEMAVQF